jgi:GT2 family glycosyltransferase
MTENHVHFIAVSFHGSATLCGYLESLLAQDCDAWRMTVIDNSEDPGELKALQRISSNSSRVRIRRAPSNLGYFAGANWHVRTSGQEIPSWTVVSNVDVRLDSTNFVRQLLEGDHGEAVAAPSVTAIPTGRPQNPYMATRPTVAAMRFRRVVLAHPATAQAYILGTQAVQRLRLRGTHSRNDRTDSRITPIYAPHGSIIAFHRRYFDAGGTLAHPTFLFNEELTVAETCRRLGLKIIYNPTLWVSHHEHQATRVWRNIRMLRAQSEAATYGYRLIAGASRRPSKGEFRQTTTRVDGPS